MILILGFSRIESEKISKIFQSNPVNASTFSLPEDVSISKQLRSAGINTYRTGQHKVDLFPGNNDFSRLFLENFHILMKLAARQQVHYSSIPFDRLEEFTFGLKYAVEDLMLKLDPVLIYTKTYPQFLFEYLVFLYAQSVNIPFVFEQQVPYFNRMILSSAKLVNGKFSIDSRFRAQNIDHAVRPENFTRQRISQTLLHVVESQRVPSGKALDATPAPFSRIFEESLKKTLLRVIFDIIKTVLSIAISSNKRERIESLKRFRIVSRSRSAVQQVSFFGALNKYVVSHFSQKTHCSELASLSVSQTSLEVAQDCVIYFGGQEPEATLLVNGGRYNSNISAVDDLRSWLGKDIDFYFKEAPSAFMAHRISGFPGTEPENMPDWVRRFLVNGNYVRLLPLDVHKSKLLRGSNVIATVSGSVGFEAALLGLRSLIFSGTWYAESDHPNVLQRDQWSLSSCLLNADESVGFFLDFFETYLSNSCPYDIKGTSPVVNRASLEFKSMLLNQLLSKGFFRI